MHFFISIIFLINNRHIYPAFSGLRIVTIFFAGTPALFFILRAFAYLRDVLNVILLKKFPIGCHWIRDFYFDKRNHDLYDEYNSIPSEPKKNKEYEKKKKIQDKLRKLANLTGQSDSFHSKSINGDSFPNKFTSSDPNKFTSSDPKSDSLTKSINNDRTDSFPNKFTSSDPTTHESTEDKDNSLTKIPSIFEPKQCVNPRKIVMKLIPGFIEIFIFFFLLIIWDIHYFIFE